MLLVEFLQCKDIESLVLDSCPFLKLICKHFFGSLVSRSKTKHFQKVPKIPKGVLLQKEVGA